MYKYETLSFGCTAMTSEDEKVVNKYTKNTRDDDNLSAALNTAHGTQAYTPHTSPMYKLFHYYTPHLSPDTTHPTLLRHAVMHVVMHAVMHSRTAYSNSVSFSMNVINYTFYPFYVSPIHLRVDKIHQYYVRGHHNHLQILLHDDQPALHN